jgi:hypothetical protein
MITLTHCGKLGDFIYCQPIASWLYKTTGKKIHWVLPNNFKPFTQIESLLRLQPYHGKLSLVPFPVKTWGCGGQPYKFDPRKFGVDCKSYYNLGFRWWPKKSVVEYQAEEHGFGWDKDFKLIISAKRQFIEPIVGTEYFSGRMPVIDLNQDILYNARRMATADICHCNFSGMAAIMYFSRIYFNLHREPWQPKTSSYFPDSNRFNLIEESNSNPPAEISRDKRLTQFLVVKGLLGL